MSFTAPRPGLRHVFVRDMMLEVAIGVHAHEQGRLQRVRMNVDLGVVDEGAAERAVGVEDLAYVVDYQRVARLMRTSARSGHVRLVETLAERIADGCMALDPRILVVRVMVEKLDVFGDAASAGVAIERTRDKFVHHPAQSPIDSQ